MAPQGNTFHPLTKSCAYFGAAVCGLFAVTEIFSGLFTLPDVTQSLFSITKGLLILGLAWSFWYTGKFGKNPFAAIPFNKANSEET